MREDQVRETCSVAGDGRFPVAAAIHARTEVSDGPSERVGDLNHLSLEASLTDRTAKSNSAHETFRDRAIQDETFFALPKHATGTFASRKLKYS